MTTVSQPLTPEEQLSIMHSQEELEKRSLTEPTPTELEVRSQIIFLFLENEIFYYTPLPFSLRGTCTTSAAGFRKTLSSFSLLITLPTSSSSFLPVSTARTCCKTSSKKWRECLISVSAKSLVTHTLHTLQSLRHVSVHGHVISPHIYRNK